MEAYSSNSGYKTDVYTQEGWEQDISWITSVLTKHIDLTKQVFLAVRTSLREKKDT